MAQGDVLGFIKNRPQNIVINGGMDFWQEKEGAISSLGSGNTYISDMFSVNTSGMGTHNYSRSTIVPNENFRYSFFADAQAIGNPGAGGACIIQHRIEGNVARRVYGKKITISFWVRTNKAGIYSLSISNGAVGSLTYVSEYEVTVGEVNVWVRKSITLDHQIAGSVWADNEGLGILLNFWLASGTNYYEATKNAWVARNIFAESASDNQVNFFDDINNEFRITGIMLNEGPVAPEFEISGSNYVDELQLCQRYYLRVVDQVQQSIHSPSYTGTGVLTYYHPTRMRIPPVVTFEDGVGTLNRFGANNSTPTSGSLQGIIPGTISPTEMQTIFRTASYTGFGFYFFNGKFDSRF